MDIIGLTGGIGSGKSTVSRLLREWGLPVIDADVLARDAVAPGTAALAAIVDHFGPVVLNQDGSLARKQLGARVFGHPAELQYLNGIVHPAVAALSMERFAALSEQGWLRAVYEVPLLFENGMDAWLRPTVLVACSEAVQLQRLMARDGSDPADAQARIDSQLSVAAKRSRATFVIDNDGDVEALAKATRSLVDAQQWLPAR
jgi:dephospho-CoA kinase